MTPITILDAALARGARTREDGSISMDAVEDTGLPFFGGCATCEASCAAHNMHPSTTGMVQCAACIGERGFPSAAAFEAWCVYQDAVQAAADAELERIEAAERAAWRAEQAELDRLDAVTP